MTTQQASKANGRRGTVSLSTDTWAVVLALGLALLTALGFITKVPW
jgi:hypothetical protein